MPGTPCANFAICGRCGASLPTWEDTVAAVFFLSPVNATECEDHHCDREYTEDNT
jgi:ribosomal protein L40E